jgi:hypothetical protein
MKLNSIRNTGIVAILALFMTFSGCSSDNSNETSTGGGSTTPPPEEPVDPASLAGTYTGTATATASALGITESKTVPVTIIIDQNGTVSIQSGSDLFPNVITLSGNTFGHSQTFNNESFGSATCSGTLTLQGSINNGVLSATLSSQSVTCNGVPGTVSGTMTATKQ